MLIATPLGDPSRWANFDASAYGIPPDVAASIQRAVPASIDPSAGGAFIPAQSLTAAQKFWLRHKTKVMVGGAVAGGALLIWFVAR